jgi:putative FmdB family regulatory protein
MPIYEYECPNGHRIEVMHGIDASGPATCATCGAPLHKLLARPAIVFKGSGWAKKDARSSAGRRPAARSGGAESAARPGGDATEAKEAKPSGSKADGAQGGGGAGGEPGQRDAPSSAPASAAGPPERG